MTDRVIDISDSPAALSVRNELLTIRRGDETHQVPLSETAVVVLAHPAVTCTHAALAGLAEHGAVLIVCGRDRLPAAMLLPTTGHHAQAERFDRQAHASLPTRKRLWQQIVRAKIRAQSRLLVRIAGEDRGLADMARRVRSGDPQNVEAAAARKYWRALFGEKFRRRYDAQDQNRNLNYGYAVLRATVARAICAAGLHPSLGLHHHNRYDAYCLASDLAEPFRPVVDEAVHAWLAHHAPDAPLDKEAKSHLLEALMRRYNIAGEWRTLFNVVSRTAASLAAVFEGRRKTLLLPEI